MPGSQTVQQQFLSNLYLGSKFHGTCYHSVSLILNRLKAVCILSPSPACKGPAYSNVGLITVEYALSRHLWGILWLAAFIIPRVLLDFAWISSICFVRYKSFDSITPKCLWDFTTSSSVWLIMMEASHLLLLLFEINIILIFEALPQGPIQRTIEKELSLHFGGYLWFQKVFHQ